MNCDTCIDLLSERLDGAISPENEALLAAHLCECEDCRALAALMERAHAELEIMAVEPPAALLEGVRSALAAEPVATAPRGNNQKKRWLRYGALAAVLVVVVLAAYALPRSLSGRKAEFAAADMATAAVTEKAAPMAPEAGTEESAAECAEAYASDDLEMAAESDELMSLAPAAEPAGAAEPELSIADGIEVSEVLTNDGELSEGVNGWTGSAAAPALPYHESFSAILVWTGAMPAELEGYSAETGTETEIYVFVPTADAQHMIESGAYTTYLWGPNVAADAETAVVVVYGEAADAEN